MVKICAPSTKKGYNSIKYHWPRHWAHTRLQLGWAAEKKTLERKLGQSQKRNFRFTNRQEDTYEAGQFKFGSVPKNLNSDVLKILYSELCGNFKFGCVYKIHSKF
jgi:hypothetical protein